MIIGREVEKKILNKVYQSREAEFVVIFGRRRVGKTFLIREYFNSKKCKFFHATGLQKGSFKNQLRKFSEALSKMFFENVSLETPKDWHQAFDILHNQISKSNEKVIIFLDELPWMVTRKSGLLEEIDYYWNHYWSRMPNIILIICGSSASWLLRKIIYNKGGLHNRVTNQMQLLPFNLGDTKKYLKSRGVKLNNKHILSIYMAVGGIPYYLRYIEPKYTAEQNIQRLFFDRESPLKDEFKKLFDSLFENAQSYLELVTLIARTKEGMSRSVLKSLAKLSTGGGRLSARLQDLCETGFIEEFIPWNKSKGEYYKVIDEFSLFYLHWVGPHKKGKFGHDYWIDQSQSPVYYAWSGYAFEAVCMKHISQIINALKIRVGQIGSWRFRSKNKTETGTQIDLILDRKDNAITLGEIKYTNKPFMIDKQYADMLRRRVAIFKDKNEIDKQIFLAIISATGLKKNRYSDELVDGVATLDDLF